MQKEREWGRWTRFNTKDGRGRFVWESSNTHNLLSTVMSLTTDKSQSLVESLPAQGLFTFTRQGDEMPFPPKHDDRFWGKMLRFYKDAVTESVSIAKEQARSACLLVIKELESLLQSKGTANRTVIFFCHSVLPLPCTVMSFPICRSIELKMIVAYMEQEEFEKKEEDIALLLEAKEKLQKHLDIFDLEHPNTNYYYYTKGIDENRNGPVKFDELAALYKKDVVHLDTYIWHKQLGDKWIKLKNNGLVPCSFF